MSLFLLSFPPPPSPVKGDHPKRELLHLVDELPQMLQGVAEKTKALQSVVDFYHKFSQYVRGYACASLASAIFDIVVVC